MHVRVDEPRHHVAAAGVQALPAVVGPDPGDAPVGHGDVALEPFAGEGAEDPPALHDEVRLGLAPGHGQQARAVGGRVGHQLPRYVL